MKGKDLKNNKMKIDLRDGKHEIAIDFNACESLEEIYGDMGTAFDKFKGEVKFTDVKKFICAGINACIEDEEKHYTHFQIGKLLKVNKMTEYVDILLKAMNQALPIPKEADADEEEDENEKN